MDLSPNNVYFKHRPTLTILGDNLVDDNEKKVNQELMSLVKQFRAHIKAYNEHVEDCREKFMISESNYEYLRHSAEKTNRLLTELTTSTKDMVQLQNDLIAAGRLAVRVQKFATFWLKWPLIIAALGAIFNFGINIMQGGIL